MKEEEVGPLVARARRMFSDVTTLPVPVITALDGGAFGGGLELALATDIRIAGMNTMPLEAQIKELMRKGYWHFPTLFLLILYFQRSQHCVLGGGTNTLLGTPS